MNQKFELFIEIFYASKLFFEVYKRIQISTQQILKISVSNEIFL